MMQGLYFTSDFVLPYTCRIELEESRGILYLMSKWIQHFVFYKQLDKMMLHVPWVCSQEFERPLYNTHKKILEL